MVISWRVSKRERERVTGRHTVTERQSVLWYKSSHLA